MKPVPYGRQSITEEDIQAVVSVLKSDFLTQGPVVEEFEQAVCEATNSKYAVAVSNGTAALHLSALALNVQPGDRVLCPSNTFVASSNCIEYCGGIVEFVDIDPATLCVDVKLLQEKLGSAPSGHYKGLVVVDFAGYVPDLEQISSLCEKHGVWIIEDASHAFGSAFKNLSGDRVQTGSCMYSTLTTFSFHPVKHVAMGEGGVITTDSADLAQKIRSFRTHGITKDKKQLINKDSGPWYYEMQSLGYNYRVPDLLCALGCSQIKRLEQNLKRRREIAKIYNERLKDLPMDLPPQSEHIAHGYHLYVIQTDRRRELYDYLKEHSIFSQVHYIPVHTQPYYEAKYGKQSLVHAEEYYKRALSLPMYHGLSDDQQEYVIGKIQDFFKV